MAGQGPGSKVLSVRIEADLLERISAHAARRGMSLQDYVIRTLVRDDFDERFSTAVTETQRFYAGDAGTGQPRPERPSGRPAAAAPLG